MATPGSDPNATTVAKQLPSRADGEARPSAASTATGLPDGSTSAPSSTKGSTLGPLGKPPPLDHGSSSRLTALSSAPIRRRTPLQRKLMRFVDSKSVTALMTLVTFFALFGDDFRLAAVDPSGDNAFFAISFLALVLFTIELLLNSFAKRNYVCRFYFWLDLLATLSLVPDIGWLWNPIVGEDGNATGTSTGAIRAGRASRAGTRAGRIVRIVRLVRLVRIMKLYKHVKEGQEQLSHGGRFQTRPRRSSQVAMSSRRKSSMTIDEPSQVGKTLSDLTTRRVILLVLAMILILPFFDINTFEDNINPAQEFGLITLHKLSFTDPRSGIFNQTLNQYLVDGGTMLHLKLTNMTTQENFDYLSTFQNFESEEYYYNTNEIVSDFRTDEAPLLEVGGCYSPDGLVVTDGCSSFVYFNNRERTRTEALLNIGKTLFVMVILATGAILFTRDAESLVIQPIERMVHIVKQLAEDPLGALTNPELHPLLAQGAGGYETRLLEQTLAKIAGLLQISFGEAGAHIIALNMKKGGSLNPMVEGHKMTGVFGFCDIRQFTDATECLQEEVMVFVNQIGDIVHFATHQYAGAANKNIGDAFLLVWRVIEESEILMQQPLSHQDSQRSNLMLEDEATQHVLAAKDSNPTKIAPLGTTQQASSGAGSPASAHSGPVGPAASKAARHISRRSLLAAEDLMAGKNRTPRSAAVLPLPLKGTVGSELTQSHRSMRSQPSASGESAGGLSRLSPIPDVPPAVGLDTHRTMDTQVLSHRGSPSPPHVTCGRASRRRSTDAQSNSEGESRVLPIDVQLADNALFAFLKIIVDIENSNTDGVLKTYAEHPKIKARFPSGYKVRMGFGLHFGWAIEGAIGSRFKIDASYLSPNVNMAARLEAATKQYGVPLLMSSDFTKRLSPEAFNSIRLLDRVTVKGSNLPIELYTYDVSHIPDFLGCNLPDTITDAEFDVDPIVPLLQHGIPPEFFTTFNKGVNDYLAGDWGAAKEALESVLEINPEDGPSSTLLRVMKETHFRAPVDWPGYRELTEK